MSKLSLKPVRDGKSCAQDFRYQGIDPQSDEAIELAKQYAEALNLGPHEKKDFWRGYESVAAC